MKRRDLLNGIAWAQDEYGSLVTTSQYTRRDVMRAVAAGLVESVGLVTVYDPDGHPYQPERIREGFRLTEAGCAVVQTGD